MESHLIFKYRKKMKIFVQLSALFLVLLLLNSCQDSLGYDPNTTVSKIGQDTIIAPPDTNETPQIITIDSVSATFREFVIYHRMLKQSVWTGKTIRRRILFDTTGVAKKIWIDWAMVSDKRDADYIVQHRIDRVYKFEVLFGAILEPKTFNLDKDKKAMRWFSLYLKRMSNDKLYEFNTSNDLDAKIIFVDNDKEEGKLTFLLSASLPIRAPFQVKKFEGLINIFYKKQ